MIAILEKTWFAGWIFANLMIVRWFHVVRSRAMIKPALDQKKTAQKSAAAA